MYLNNELLEFPKKKNHNTVIAIIYSKYSIPFSNTTLTNNPKIKTNRFHKAYVDEST